MLGFSWGFQARDGEIALVEPKALDSDAWDSHLDILRTMHPVWHFSAGPADLS